MRRTEVSSDRAPRIEAWRAAPRSPRSRARRVAVKALVLAVLVLPAALLFLLYRPGVQVRLLAAALRKAEESTGLSLSAREVSMDPLRGRLVLRGVAAAVPGSRPFLTADEAEVEIDVREGFRRRLHVRHVAAEGVRIDLSAPLPASQGTSTGDLTFLSAAEIDHIDVGISSFVSGPLPPSLRDVALGARIEKARLTGSLRGGTLTLRGDLPTVVVDRPGPLRLAAAGDVALSLTAAGRIDLEAFHLAGDGFSASAWGATGLSADAPIALHAEVSAEPGKVAPELRTTGTLRLVADVGGSRSALSATLAVDGRDVRTPDVALETVSVKARLNEGTLLVEAARADLRPGGHVEGEGRFDLAAGDGTWTVRAERLPDGLLAAYADEATRARWGIAGSELDGVATVRHGRGDPFPLSVDAELSLSRAGTALAAATARLESRGADDARLLGDVPPRVSRRAARGGDPPGARRSRASRRAASSTAGSASPSPDLAAAHAELRALFPSLVAAAPEGVDLAGAFRLDVRAAGPLRAPRAEIDAAFDPARGGSLSLRATADAARRSVEGTLSVSGLSAGSVRPGATGLASADARFALGPKQRDVRVTLDATGLCLAEELPLLENLHASLEAEGPELRLVELAARPARALPRSGSAGTAPRGLGPRLARRRPSATPTSTPSVSAGVLSAEAHALPATASSTLDVPRAGRPRPRGGPRRATAARRAARRSPRSPPPPARPPRGAARADARRAGPRFLRSRDVPPRRDADVVPLSRRPPRLRDRSPSPIRSAARRRSSSRASPPRPPAGRLGALRPGAPHAWRADGSRSSRSPSTGSGRRSASRRRPTSSPAHASDGPLAGLVSHVTVSARGRADAALLTPFLAGGTASGEIALDARAAGPPDALEGHVFLDGKGSRFSWPLAWPTEIRDPLLEAELTPGSASLTRGEALLNGGPLLLSGGWYRGRRDAR